MKVKSFSYISVVEGKVLPPYCEVSGEFFKQNSPFVDFKYFDK